jgi:hypothetical protein
MSVVSVVRCRVKFFATGLSLVHRISTECVDIYIYIYMSVCVCVCGCARAGV